MLKCFSLIDRQQDKYVWTNVCFALIDGQVCVWLFVLFCVPDSQRSYSYLLKTQLSEGRGNQGRHANVQDISFFKKMHATTLLGCLCMFSDPRTHTKAQNLCKLIDCNGKQGFIFWMGFNMASTWIFWKGSDVIMVGQFSKMSELTNVFTNILLGNRQNHYCPK